MQTRLPIGRGRTFLGGLGLLALIGSGVSCSSSASKKAAAERERTLVVDFTAERRSVATTLDTFHASAAKADLAAYTACFAPDLVFLGTDPKERWNNMEFTAFAKSHFDQGKGWTYTLVPGSRTITVDQPLLGAGVATAWFDEMLDNESYGRCRGSGVLRKIGGRWLVSQYNLAFSVPNEVAEKVVQLNRAATK